MHFPAKKHGKDLSFNEKSAKKSSKIYIWYNFKLFKLNNMFFVFFKNVLPCKNLHKFAGIQGVF